MTFKSRFAPSPTGLLHLGNARSAIINWAYINSKNGEFILRIDDTDKKRSKLEYVEYLKKDLSWLGIKWSKTFNQSSRLELYKEKIDFLKKSEKLYPCFETAEELSLKRKTLLSSGKPPIYDRNSLKLSKQQINDLLKQGKKPHWRFKLKENLISWNDLIKGRVTFNAKNLSDPILIREDESLLYHLPSVIDDIEEGITDIIRGEDHISNTAFHIQIFEAFNSKIPIFGHHPFLVDNKGEGFSKRISSLSIQELRKKGFESISIMNYLATIGTSKNISNYNDLNLLIDKFSIKDIASSNPKFSLDNLENINKNILQSYNFIDIKNKFEECNIQNVNENFWNFIKFNINYFKESVEWWNIVNSGKVHNDKNNHEFFQIAAELLPQDPYDLQTWDTWIKKIRNKSDRNGKDLFMPLRLALTGREKGPEMKYLLPLLNRDQILKKLGF